MIDATTDIRGRVQAVRAFDAWRAWNEACKLVARRSDMLAEQTKDLTPEGRRLYSQKVTDHLQREGHDDHASEQASSAQVQHAGS